MGVGRKRKDGNPLGLEPRVEWHHGQFRYLHRDGRKEPLGKDVGKANERAKVYNDPDGIYGTLGYYVKLFLAEARSGRLPAGHKLAERSISDYEDEADLMSLSPLWKMFPPELVGDPSLIGTYRDKRVVDGKGEVQANHALSLLSATYTWLIERGHCPGLIVNPVKLVSRFSRKPKDRYVEDHEYNPVHQAAIIAVRMAVELAYQTLQRPGDLLALPPNPTRLKTVASKEKHVLPVYQSKTGRTVDIEVTPELEKTLGMLAPPKDEKVVRLAKALIHGRAGRRYTEMGMGSMLRRTCHQAKVKTFGLMDVRAKGATDMYLRGVSLETIQLLMGHKSVQTTEIYIKRMLATISTVAPNSAMVGN